MDISVILPTSDEEKNIGTLIKELKNVLSVTTASFEIIVIDDNSTDKTQQVARESGAKVLVQKSPGYGGALKDGFSNANGDYLITMDADLSHDPVVIKDMLKNRDKGELIVASRYVKGGSVESGGIFRKVLSIILNRVFACVLSLPYKDISSGFRMYKREVLDGLKIEARDFDVQEEIFVKIHKKGCRIIEIPFRYKIRKGGKSHVRLFKFAVSYIKTLFRMWKLGNSL